MAQEVSESKGLEAQGDKAPVVVLQGAKAMRRTAVALSLAAVVMGLGQTTLFTFLPLLMHHTGLDLANLTLAFAIGSGLFLVGAPLWAWLSDRLGRRLVVGVALVGFGLSHVLLLWQVWQGPLWQGQNATLLAGRVLYGLTVSGLIPTCQAWLADMTTPDQRLAAISRLSAGLTLGRLLGPALAAASIWLHPLGPLWLVALAAWPALLALPLARSQSTTVRAVEKTIFPWRRLGLWLGFAAAMQLALGQVQYTIGPWLTQRFLLEPSQASAQLGWMLTACAIVVMVLQLGVIPRCKPSRALLLLGSAALVSAGGLLAFGTGMVAIWLGFLALGIAAAFLVPTYTTLASLAAGPAHQARVAGAVAATHTVGFSLAAALAGGLFGLWPPAPFYLTGLLGLGMLAVAAIATLPPPPTHSASDGKP